MHVAIVDKLETCIEEFFDYQNWIQAPSDWTRGRLHVATRVIDDAIDAARFKRVEDSFVEISAAFGRGIV